VKLGQGIPMISTISLALVSERHIGTIRNCRYRRTTAVPRTRRRCSQPACCSRRRPAGAVVRDEARHRYDHHRPVGPRHWR
jgi:hypothetical protein